MAECSALREEMPLLLTESLDSGRRELAHQHIEICPACSAEWTALRDTWRLMGDLPEVEVPGYVKERFLAQLPGYSGQANVIPFHRRPAMKWIAQAAAVVILAGGGYFAGNRRAPVRLEPTPAKVLSAQPVAYSIAESRVLSANAISPEIVGRPDIQNVHFTDANPSDGQIGLSFDITSHVTVNGSPSDKSMVRLMSYLLESDSVSPARSRALDLVRQTYSHPQHADPEIATALGKVLRSDSHEGVRIKAVETLSTLPLSMATQTREALIEALKSDPNPSVRIKAVEALANLARSGGSMDMAAVDMLRQKAEQDDENLYVRVKAAEALSTIHP